MKISKKTAIILASVSGILILTVIISSIVSKIGKLSGDTMDNNVSFSSAINYEETNKNDNTNLQDDISEYKRNKELVKNKKEKEVSISFSGGLFSDTKEKQENEFKDKDIPVNNAEAHNKKIINNITGKTPPIKKKSNIQKKEVKRVPTFEERLAIKKKLMEQKIEINSPTSNTITQSTSIKCAIYGTQTVAIGGIVKIRILENCIINNNKINKNTILHALVSATKTRAVLSIQNGKDKLVSYGHDSYIGIPVDLNELADILEEEASDEISQDIGRVNVGGIDIGSIINSVTNKIGRKKDVKINFIDNVRFNLK